MTIFKRKIDQDFFYEINSSSPEIKVILDIINSDCSVALTKNHDDETALHIASSNGYQTIAEILLDKGADINALNVHGESPIRQAVQHQKVEMVEFLCKANANLNLDTPLHEAAFNGNVKIAKILCDYDSNPNHLDHEKNTPLHYIVGDRLIGEISENHIQITEILIAKGANPLQKDSLDLCPTETLKINKQVSDEVKSKMNKILNKGRSKQGFLFADELKAALDEVKKDCANLDNNENSYTHSLTYLN